MRTLPWLMATLSLFTPCAGAGGPLHLRSADWRLQILEESDQGLELRLSLEPSVARDLALLSGLAIPEDGAAPLDVGDWIALPPLADPVAEVVAERWSDGRLVHGGAPCWSLSAPVLWMGGRFCALNIDPVHLTEGAGAVLQELQLRISFQGGDPVNPGRAQGAHSRIQLERARRTALNPGLVERLQAERTAELPLARYLVVGKATALDFLADWAAWRREQGCEVSLQSSESLGVTGDNWQPIHDAAQAMQEADGLDYLLLVGDMNLDNSGYHLPGDMVPGGPHAEPNWGYNIVSDHSLALLEGDDYFADVVVGRFPADNATQVSIMAKRLLLYDQQPLLADADWLQKATVVYDVSGAGSRRETSLAVRQHLMERGIALVDTIWNNRDSSPQSPSLVTNAINDGRVLVNYRGFGFRYSWNGPLFGTSQINQLANYGHWPVVTSIVCGGGDFASANYDPCMGEAFLRAGSVVEPAGAVAFIGPSEEDTHSIWNNCLNLGIYQGLLREDIRDVGGLLERGKGELWRSFPNDRDAPWLDPGSSNQAQNVRFYFYCYNLLGDPGTRVRLGEQRVLAAQDFDPPAQGDTHMELQVVDELGLPADSVWVCLTGLDQQRLALGRTDSQGGIELSFAPLGADSCLLVAHGDDCVPLRLEFLPVLEPSCLVLEDWHPVLADSLLAAGDVFLLSLTLREAGSAGSEAGQTLEVEALDAGLLTVTATQELPARAPGQEITVQDLLLQVTPSVEDGQVLPMRLRMLDTAGEELWERTLTLTAAGAHPALELLTTTPSQPGPGDQVQLSLGLRNAGPLPLDADSCRLYAMSTAIGMIVADGLFATLDPGAEGEAGPFEFTLDEGLVDGARLNLELVFFRADGSTAARLPFTLEVGQVGTTDPVGPDDYGYVIYHHNDSSELAPDYAYVDVRQNGTEIPMNDEGVAFNEEGLDGVSRAVALPFTFRFYGQDYDTITVNSNGWIAMGDQTNHFLGINTPIPAAQGPNAMIAVFWTDLYNYYGNSRFGHCYRYHDAAQHTYVIQWWDFQHTGHPYQDNYFEAILRDPAYWPTPTGDGEVLLQYEDLVTSFGDMYFTVGVERPDQMAGLQYTFNNDYGEAAQPVQSQTALLITTATRYAETALAPPSRPAGLEFLAAAPNPFNPETVISLVLPSAAPLRLSVYNLRGELVKRLHDGPASAGRLDLRFDARGLAGGVYLVEARQAGLTQVRRVLYLP